MGEGQRVSLSEANIYILRIDFQKGELPPFEAAMSIVGTADSILSVLASRLGPNCLNILLYISDRVSPLDLQSSNSTVSGKKATAQSAVPNAPNKFRNQHLR